MAEDFVSGPPPYPPPVSYPPPFVSRGTGSVRRQRLLVILVLLGTAVLVLGLLLTGPRLFEPAVGVGSGQRAPDFTLKDLNGHPVSLHQFRGHLVLLHFWAVDCPYCGAEWATLQQVERKIHNPPVVVSVDVWQEPASYVAAYVNAHHLPGTFLIDPSPRHAATNTLYGPYRGLEVPTTFLIEPDGTLYIDLIGERSFDDYRTALARYDGAAS